MYAGAALSAVVLVSAVFFGIKTLDLIISFTQVHVLAPLTSASLSARRAGRDHPPVQ
jgi:hypothetical protein